MIYTQGAVAQMDDTVKHREHSHSGTVNVEKQQQQQHKHIPSEKFNPIALF